MRTIYFKKAKDKYESLSEMLEHYFNAGCPSTYWSDTHSEQCDSGRNRSVEDFLLLSNHYFPETSIENMMRAFREWNKKLLNDNKELIFAVCSTIGRVRLINAIYNTGKYHVENMLYVKGMDGNSYNGDYKMRDLKEIMEHLDD